MTSRGEKKPPVPGERRRRIRRECRKSVVASQGDQRIQPAALEKVAAISGEIVAKAVHSVGICGPGWQFAGFVLFEHVEGDAGEDGIVLGGVPGAFAA